ncbi:hypothetical protein BLNAU_21331 [Blattamonas nauphoetae]|uniref:Uncharacterized protein n=1 Tax=Blattamonas nauphoetae TaxID=2049346 RepID=A0ABQ9WW80_9EUKA|nr:hypothetical protein BLNAU_21331 [Blattamonas nauphoetae]
MHHLLSTLHCVNDPTRMKLNQELQISELPSTLCFSSTDEAGCYRSRFAPVAADVSPRHQSVKTTQRPVAALPKGVTVFLSSMVQRVKPKTMDAFSFQLIYHLFSFCSFQVS